MKSRYHLPDDGLHMTDHLWKSKINKVNKSTVAANWQTHYHLKAGGQLEWEHLGHHCREAASAGRVGVPAQVI